MRAQSTISDFLSNVFVAFRVLADAAGAPTVNIYGPRDDGANSAPPGIWWAPGGETWERTGLRGGQPGVPGSLWVRNIPITMLVFGGENAPITGDADYAASAAGTFLRDTDATEALVELLVNAFQQQVSQFSYEIRGGHWGDSERTGVGIAFEMDLVLRLPLVRIDNETVTLTGLTTTTRLPNE